MVQVFVWLAALAVVLIAGAVFVCHWLMGRRLSRAILASSLALALVYCLLGAEAAKAIPAFNSGGALLYNFGIAVLIAMAVALQLWAASWLIQKHPQRRKAGLAALLVCQVLLAGASGWRFQTALVQSEGIPMEGGLGMDLIEGEALLTDKGRLVPVFQAEIVGNLRGYSEYSQGAFSDQRIEQAPDDYNANCHGWVFTGGRYLLKGNGVEMILADNGYRQVKSPQPGDVIVYRDFANQIVHTGLVRMALEDGLVLVESKWGISGRYIHKPEGQFYSQSYEYYRQPLARQNDTSSHFVQAVRILPGNTIVALHPETALAAQAQPAPPPAAEVEPGYPMPAEAEYPLGAE